MPGSELSSRTTPPNTRLAIMLRTAQGSNVPRNAARFATGAFLDFANGSCCADVSRMRDGGLRLTSRAGWLRFLSVRQANTLNSPSNPFLAWSSLLSHCSCPSQWRGAAWSGYCGKLRPHVKPLPHNGNTDSTLGFTISLRADALRAKL